MENNKTPIMIVGTDTEARIALDIANVLDVMVYGFLADDEALQNRELNDVLIIAALGSKDSDTLLNDENIKVVIAEREIPKRKEFVSHLNDKQPELINLIHPSRSISPYSKLGRGNLIYQGLIVQPNVMFGSFNLVESNVTIGPDCQIGDYCTLQDGVKLGREVYISNEAFVGMGAIIHGGVSIGKGAMVGAGSVVFTDVPDGGTVFGNPAKEAS